ncbi:MAG TPA: hypothetical protein VFO59_03045 [Dehalococcoidia bacterium]|nr:hypothetical protein [Dehalococcoidia bacterium]
MPVEQIMARIRRALLLDVGVFEETRDDRLFTPIAIAIAGGSALLAGIGAFLWSAFILDETQDFFLEATVLGTIFLLLLWLVGMIAAYFVLSQVYHESVALDGLIRVMCLGSVPFALSALVFIPGFGFGLAMIAIALTFFYTNYGVRAAYPDIDPMRVMIACLAAMAVWSMVLPLLTSTDNQFAPGPFVFEWSEDFLEDLFSIATD